jgi:hypothetical protein
MNHLKAFIAGIALPSFILPFFLLIAFIMGKPQLLGIPFLHFIPMIWGIWNVLYFIFFINILPKEPDFRLLLTGGTLGLLIGLIGVFCLGIPNLMGLSAELHFLPLVVAPIVYAILWLFILKPLNKLLGLKI